MKKFFIGLWLVPSLITFGVSSNGQFYFSYPVATSLTLNIALGESKGLGLGFVDDGFEFGVLYGEGLQAYTVFSHHQKLFMLETQGIWFVSTGSVMRDVSYTFLSLKRTPPIMRFAARMALVPRCKRGDEECERARKATLEVLDTIFETAAMFKGIEMEGGYGMGAVSVGDDGIGFFQIDGGVIFGVGRTDGESMSVAGVGYVDGFAMGIGASVGVFKNTWVDFIVVGGSGGFNFRVGLDVALKDGRAVLLTDGKGVYFFIK